MISRVCYCGSFRSNYLYAGFIPLFLSSLCSSRSILSLQLCDLISGFCSIVSDYGAQPSRKCGVAFHGKGHLDAPLQILKLN